MSHTPLDIVQYILNENLEAAFLTSLAYHIEDYTISEIVDKQFVEKNGLYHLKSKAYSLNVAINDEDIATALHNGLYVTPFLSRHLDTYQVHFLVHQYPTALKAQFDEAILQEVLQYMILKTVKALRLDTYPKVDAYISKSSAK